MPENAKSIFMCMKYLILHILALYNTIHHMAIRNIFWPHCNRKPKGSGIVSLWEKMGRFFWCYFQEKVNFVFIYEFRYGHTCKIWASPFCLSLYKTFTHKDYDLLLFSVTTVVLVNDSAFFWGPRKCICLLLCLYSTLCM